MTVTLLLTAPAPDPWCPLCRGRHGPHLRHRRPHPGFAPEDQAKADTLIARGLAATARGDLAGAEAMLTRINVLRRKRRWFS